MHGVAAGRQADALCNAEYGQVSDERVNHRNGYRPREWGTRAVTVELAIPKRRSGSYFPHWLPERRWRAEQALGDNTFGDTGTESIRVLKRRLSDVVDRALRRGAHPAGEQSQVLLAAARHRNKRT